MYTRHHKLTRMVWQTEDLPLTEQLTVRLGGSEAMRPQLVALYCHAFEQKMQGLFGSWEHAVDVLTKTLALDMTLIALHQQQIVGFAGLAYGTRRLFDLELPVLMRAFGPLRGLETLVRLAILDTAPRKAEILIESLVVRTEMRGQGVGSRLLQAVFAFARENGFASVGLEVVDTNPGAQRLYERLGFVAAKTYPLPRLGRMMGFNTVTKMEKILDEGE